MTFDQEREKHKDGFIRIVIETRVPSKWRFVDLETKQIWQYHPENPQGFRFVVDNNIKMLQC